MKIWRMAIACWIPKAIKTHLVYVLFIAFALQQRLDEDAHLCYVMFTLSNLFIVNSAIS